MSRGLIILNSGIFLVFLFAWWTPFVFSQESVLQSYLQNFTRANLSAKAWILQDAADDEDAAEFIGPLYEFALRFVLANAEILRDDP